MPKDGARTEKKEKPKTHIILICDELIFHSAGGECVRVCAFVHAAIEQ